MPTRIPDEQALDKFLEHCEPVPWSGCWIWMGAQKNTGYGYWQYKGEKGSAHRWSYRLHKGDISRGLFVLHSCDTRICVNPEHLRVGTNSDNMRDAIARGRFSWKNLEAGRATKLLPTADKISELRGKGMTFQEIGKVYGVSRQAVHQAEKRASVDKISREAHGAGC